MSASFDWKLDWLVIEVFVDSLAALIVAAAAAVADSMTAIVVAAAVAANVGPIALCFSRKDLN